MSDQDAKAGSPVVLACTVGVLTEVPIMLMLVRLIRSRRGTFAEEAAR